MARWPSSGSGGPHAPSHATGGTDELTPAAIGALAAAARGAANGVASLGADSKVPAAQLPASSGGYVPNLTQVRQTTDWDLAPGAVYVQLGNIEASLSIATGSRLLVILSGAASFAEDNPLRLSVDAGQLLRPLGRYGVKPDQFGAFTGTPLAATEVIAGLSAAVHTVRVEALLNGHAYIRASTQPALEQFSILLWELPA